MNEPILDYASPRPQGKVRLPARSELSLRTDARGGVTVVETLTGQTAAIVAMMFAGGTYLSLIGTLWNEVPRLLRGPPDGAAVIPLLLSGLVVLGVPLVAAMVVDNTWRRTILTASAEGITLRFWAPLTRSREHAWEASRLKAVRVQTTSPELIAAGGDPYPSALAELQIHPIEGRIAHLFTDHMHYELCDVRDALNRVLGRPMK